MWKRWLPVLMTMFVAVAGCSQSNVGQISGHVYDATGASVPNCQVAATNAATGFRHIVNSDERGFYVFAGLPPGAYNLRAERQGFRASERPGVVLDAASRRSVDFQLEVGAVAVDLNPFNLWLSTTAQRINGVRSNSIYFNVDGADNMDNGGSPGRVLEFGLKLNF